MKRLVSAFLAGAMALSLAACGGAASISTAASASASASRPALAYGAALSRSVCSGSCLPLNAHIPAMRDRRLCSGKKFIGFPDKARKCDSGLVRPGETSHVFG